MSLIYDIGGVARAPRSVRGLSVIALLLVTLILAGCSAGAGDAARDDDRISVVASTALVADWVTAVGGERVGVRTLVGAGSDAHTWQPEPSDVIAISEADLVVLSGGGLEAGFAGVVAENADGVVVELAPALEAFAPGLRDDEGEIEGEEGRDPHFWLDAELAAGAIERLREALIALDAAQAAGYRERTAAYLSELRLVDAEVGVRLAALPAERRVLVTFHDAYGYFARRYGLTILGFVVEGPEEEPSAGDIARLVAAMESAGASLIFREPQFSARVVERVAADAGASVRPIYSQLSGEVDSYLALLRANAAVIAE